MFVGFSPLSREFSCPPVWSVPTLTRLCVCVCVFSQGAAAYPENEDQQQRLREAAEGLRVATNAAAQNAIKKKLINRLEVRRDRRAVVLSPE